MRSRKQPRSSADAPRYPRYLELRGSTAALALIGAAAITATVLGSCSYSGEPLEQSYSEYFDDPFDAGNPQDAGPDAATPLEGDPPEDAGL